MNRSEYRTPGRNTRTTSRRPGGMMLAGLVLLLVFLVSLQLAPSVSDQRRDSGIFAYTGFIISEGGRPYVDAWDNKLPGVYFIDALAFAVFGSNRWALWLVENLTLFFAALVMIWLLRRVYQRRPEVWIGPLILVLLARHPALVNDTNYTEPYALLPQVAVLAAGYQLLRDPRPRWAFIIGFAAAVALLIKQTTIGVALAFIPALLLSRHPIVRSERRWRWLGIIIAGGLACLLPVALYLLIFGILDDAINASFVMSSSFHEWVGRESVWIGRTVLTTFTSGGFPLVFGPLLPFIGIGMVLAWKQSRRRPAEDDTEGMANATLALWVLLTFCVDLVLANITNRGHAHYYVTLLPSVTILLTMVIRAMSEVDQHPAWEKRVKQARMYLVAVLLGVPLSASLVSFWHANWNIIGPERKPDIAQYVIEHTLIDDTVLVWGAATAINFQSGRKSPTQFHYAYPLIVPDYTTEEVIDEMVKDLRRNMPVLVVDTTLRDGDRIPPLDPARRRLWWMEGGRRDTADLAPIFQFVAGNCRIERTIEEVAIYRCYYDDPDPIIFKRKYAPVPKTSED